MTWITRQIVAVRCDVADCQHHNTYDAHYDLGVLGGQQAWARRMREDGWKFHQNREIECPGCVQRLALS